MTAWELADEATVQDLSTYLMRAARLDTGGNCRISGVGTIATVYVCAMFGGGGPTVLGLRTIPLAEPSDVDAVVPIAALTDRLARSANGTSLPVPPQQVPAAWAGVLPPRVGWVPDDPVDVDLLARTASDGITEITLGAGVGSGSAAVSALRLAVWSRALPGRADLPAGIAFAAHALGFLTGSTMTVHRAGPWTRVSSRVGHVIARHGNLL